MEEERGFKSEKPRKPYTCRPRRLDTGYKQMRANTWEIKILNLLRDAKLESEMNFEKDVINAIKSSI